MDLKNLSKKSAITQIYNIYQSSSVVVGLCLLHTIAFVPVYLSAIVFIYKAILSGSIVFSLFFYLKQEIKKPNFTIRHNLKTGWEIADQNNYFQSIEILPSTVLTPYAIVLHIKQQNRKKQTILIFKDALKNDEFRKLMVELKMVGLFKDTP